LLFHPHIHCVIPGGGLASDHTHWIHPRYSFFLPVKVLSKVFRGKFVDGLQRARRRGRLIFAGSIERMADPKCFAAFLRTLFRQDWVVYAKPAFGGPEQVLRYLGRYTHRIAISNHRLVAFDGRNVTFRWRDYARGNKQPLMTVSADEFIRRFLVHVLPKAFVRIRHFGFMANYRRSASLELCRQRLGMAPIIRSTEISLIGPCWTCPKCGGAMTVVERLTAAQMMFQMVLRHVVARILNRSLLDVPLHIFAHVCPFLSNASQGEVQTVTSTSKNGILLPIIPFCERSSGFDVLLSESTSTRIPLLSP